MIRRLSLLDLAPVDVGTSAAAAVRQSVELAVEAETWGYHRYWAGEHHNLPTVAASAPEVLIGNVAARTERIRVGSGGVMLPNHATLMVAERFKALHALHPDRIDLGVGRAAGTDGRTAMALGRATSGQAYNFEQEISDLLNYGRPPRGHTGDTSGLVEAMPVDAELPPLWVLGSSPSSVQLAAQAGLRYAFAHHFNPAGAQPALEHYSSAYRTAHGQAPLAPIMTVSVLSGASGEEVEKQKLHLGLRALVNAGQIPPELLTQRLLEDPARSDLGPALRSTAEQVLATAVVGEYDEVARTVDRLAQEHGVEEIMVTTNQRGHESRQLLIQALADRLLDPTGR